MVNAEKSFLALLLLSLELEAAAELCNKLRGVNCKQIPEE
jgi:hypothetical protein